MHSDMDKDATGARYKCCQLLIIECMIPWRRQEAHFAAVIMCPQKRSIQPSLKVQCQMKCWVKIMVFGVRPSPCYGQWARYGCALQLADAGTYIASVCSQSYAGGMSVASLSSWQAARIARANGKQRATKMRAGSAGSLPHWSRPAMQLLRAQREPRRLLRGEQVIDRMPLAAMAWAALLWMHQPALQTASTRAVAVALLAAMNSA